jgi:hypothetical protein
LYVLVFDCIQITNCDYTVSFQRYLAENYHNSEDQLFALDLFTHEQRVLLEYENVAVNEQGDAMFEYSFMNNSTIGDGHIIVGPSVHSYIHNHSTILGSGIVWSERQYAVNSVVQSRFAQAKNRYLSPIQHAFPIYGLSLCGHELFSNYSGNWHAQVSSNTVGIALPTQFYRMIMEWLTSKNTTTKPFSQWTKTERYALPELTFRLHQNDDSHMLRIPLHVLFEDDEFHLYDAQSADIYEGLGVLSSEPFIQLGVKVIQQLFTVFDYANYRVGFIQKTLDTPDASTISAQVSNMYCELADKSDTCVGDQTYYGPMNTCLQPQCDSYLFQTVDTKTGQCRLGISFYALFVIVILMCLLSEVLLYELYHRIIQSLYGSAAANNAALNNGIST